MQSVVVRCAECGKLTRSMPGKDEPCRNCGAEIHTLSGNLMFDSMREFQGVKFSRPIDRTVAFSTITENKPISYGWRCIIIDRRLLPDGEKCEYSWRCTASADVGFSKKLYKSGQEGRGPFESKLDAAWDALEFMVDADKKGDDEYA